MRKCGITSEVGGVSGVEEELGGIQHGEGCEVAMEND